MFHFPNKSVETKVLYLLLAFALHLRRAVEGQWLPEHQGEQVEVPQGKDPKMGTFPEETEASYLGQLFYFIKETVQLIVPCL